MENYLINIKFCLKFKERLSQGSILCPLQFLIYIYDMKLIAPNKKIIVYADDITVIVRGRNLAEGMQQSNDILDICIIL